MTKLGTICKGTFGSPSYQELTYEEEWAPVSCGHPFTEEEWKILCKQQPDFMAGSKWVETEMGDPTIDLILM